MNRRSARRSVHWPLSGLAHMPLVTLLETRIRCRVKRSRLSKSQQMIRATEASHAVPRTKTVAKISPKQPSARRLRDWYPYYASFTEQFVNAVIEDYLQGSESVVDPWSGAGTTTVACLRRGIESSGVDINPAATVIARARLNPRSASQSLLDTARSLVEEAQAARPCDDTSDLLGLWMVGDGVGEIRALVRAIRENPGRSCGTAARRRRSAHRMPVAFRLLPLHRLLRRRAQPARQVRNDEPHVDQAPQDGV